MTPGEVLLNPKPPGLSVEQALHIAQLDAEAAYGDLDDFRITIARQPDGWHIDSELLDAMRDGGGPHYVIDAWSGKILAKRYEQQVDAFRAKSFSASQFNASVCRHRHLAFPSFYFPSDYRDGSLAKRSQLYADVYHSQGEAGADS